MVTITAEQVESALYRAIQKDQANRYNLLKDWRLPKLTIAVPDYAGKLLAIQDGVITVRAYSGEVCNGCTLSPDQIGKWKLVVGALFHDPWYKDISAIAAAWNWTEADVRKLGDEIFACILVATGTPVWLTRAYLTGVRAGGGLVRTVNKLLGTTLLVLVCAGCSSCAIPDHFGNQPVTQPFYEASTNNAGSGK